MRTGRGVGERSRRFRRCAEPLRERPRADSLAAAPPVLAAVPVFPAVALLLLRLRRDADFGSSALRSRRSRSRSTLRRERSLDRARSSLAASLVRESRPLGWSALTAPLLVLREATGDLLSERDLVLLLRLVARRSLSLLDEDELLLLDDDDEEDDEREPELRDDELLSEELPVCVWVVCRFVG